MRRFGQSSYSYSPFWEYQQRTLKARLSAMVNGFDNDILERFYSLAPDQLTRLFNIYSDEYGDGPAAYARRSKTVVASAVGLLLVLVLLYVLTRLI